MNLSKQVINKYQTSTQNTSEQRRM